MIQKPGLFDGYRYLGKQIKMGWDQYGGKVMTVAGTAGLFLTGIHACRKTYKIHDKLERSGAYISAEGELREGDKKFSAKGRKVKAFIKSAASTAKDYAGDIVVGGISAYAVHKGWSKEHTHYQEAAAMASVVLADFMNYRNNVISEQGKEADRRYLTTKSSNIANQTEQKKLENGDHSDSSDGELHELNLTENSLRIWYSKETTPQVWSESYILRIKQLESIENQLAMDLIHGGSYTVNDVRREFYGRKGDIGEGGLYGRIWDPGDPAHPERGALPNLHFREDQDFMEGRTDSCWIIIDVDNEPLFELMKTRKQREIARGY